MKWSITLVCIISFALHNPLYTMEMQALDQSTALRVQAMLTVSTSNQQIHTLCSIDSMYDPVSLNLSRATVTHWPNIKQEYTPNIFTYIMRKLSTPTSDISQQFLTNLSHQTPENTAGYKMLLALLQVNSETQFATFQCSIYKKFKDKTTIIIEPTTFQCALKKRYQYDIEQFVSNTATHQYMFSLKANFENANVPYKQ